MFGLFKKKKKDEELPHYDPTNIKVIDIRKGFVLDYDLRTWEVIEEYEYDWGNNNFSYEFKLMSDSDTVFLSVEEDDHLVIQVVKKLNFSKLDESVEKALLDNGRPPRSINFNGKTYYRGNEQPGYFRNLDSEEWSEFVSWDYLDDSEKFVLNIEQWDDHEFEASIGTIVGEAEFSNILPK